MRVSVLFLILRHFDFLLFLTVFPTVISDRRYDPKTLNCNPIQSIELKIKMCQFEENCTKIEVVRVPQRETAKKSL